MRIGVCVKVVHPRAPELDGRTGRLLPSGNPALNALDRNAVEAALRLREAGGVEEIVVVAATASANLAPVREALAMGADRAAVVADPSMEGSDLLAVSAVLARLLDAEHPDLVLMGGQAEDSNGAVMPSALAERLGMPVLSQAARLAVDGGGVDGGEVVVDRQTETGYETLAAVLPCVVAVADGLNVARYPTMKGRTDARRKPVALVRVADLGLSPADVGVEGARTVVHGLVDPPARSEALRIVGADAADELVALLVAREYVS
ncbi:MAG: electron transfer flavoprotein subunit beta/FixA family protein [Acidimicrobiia bacterium]